MPFAQNFSFCMEQRGYSAYRLAKILGVSNQGVLNWLDGGNVPHKKTRQKIAEHFGITLAELDGDELPVLPPEGAKKAPATEGEGISAAKRALINAIDGLTDEQCEKLLPIVLSAKTVL
jgi:transcriptional regulator with XRE-family HTH domain